MIVWCCVSLVTIKRRKNHKGFLKHQGFSDHLPPKNLQLARFGDRCRYSHENNPGSPGSPGRKACREFLKTGDCKQLGWRSADLRRVFEGVADLDMVFLGFESVLPTQTVAKQRSIVGHILSLLAPPQNIPHPLATQKAISDRYQLLQLSGGFAGLAGSRKT